MHAHTIKIKITLVIALTINIAPPSKYFSGPLNEKLNAKS